MTNVTVFLAELGWSDSTPSPIAGDLSQRRYTRLHKKSGETVVLMESRPDPSFLAFLTMTKWLRGIGLSAPEVIAQDRANGWMLLEDLGNRLLSELIAEDQKRQQEFYDVAVDVLLQIRRQVAPPLPAPSASDLVEATELVDEWYPGSDTHLLMVLRNRLGELLTSLDNETRTVSLRDFHADNMFWMPDRTNTLRLGLLDYQDAFLVHPAYDLMSLVTDARVDVPRNVVAGTVKSYAEKSGDDLSDLGRSVAILGVQRNLRILGIFFRAARRDGKAHRLSAVPRVHNHLRRCLEHPVFNSVHFDIDQALPLPREAQ